jgi:uncharacterized protein (TIGR02217 family)
MTGFHEIRFPDNIAYGATGGPEFATTVVATGAGHEKRNVNWAEARGRWDVASAAERGGDNVMRRALTRLASGIRMRRLRS